MTKLQNLLIILLLFSAMVSSWTIVIYGGAGKYGIALDERYMTVNTTFDYSQEVEKNASTMHDTIQTGSGGFPIIEGVYNFVKAGYTALQVTLSIPGLLRTMTTDVLIFLNIPESTSQFISGTIWLMLSVIVIFAIIDAALKRG